MNSRNALTKLSLTATTLLVVALAGGCERTPTTPDRTAPNNPNLPSGQDPSRTTPVNPNTTPSDPNRTPGTSPGMNPSTTPGTTPGSGSGTSRTPSSDPTGIPVPNSNTPPGATPGTGGGTATPIPGGETPADRALIADVQDAIRREQTVTADGKNTRVVARNGEITLRGQVATQGEKDLIGSVAKGRPGVTSVVNELEVKGN